MYWVLTPEGDEDSVEDGSRVIKEVGDLGEEADVRQVPVLTADLLVTLRAHLERLAALTHLHPVRSNRRSLRVTHKVTHKVTQYHTQGHTQGHAILHTRSQNAAHRLTQCHTQFRVIWAVLAHLKLKLSYSILTRKGPNRPKHVPANWSNFNLA